MAKAKLTLDVDELQEMIDATASDKVLRELERVGMERVMNVLEAKAVELAPVDTGNLEQSIFKKGGQVFPVATEYLHDQVVFPGNHN